MGRERTLAIVIASLFVLMAGVGMAQSSQVQLESEISNVPEKGWFGSGDIVQVEATLSNLGDATSITTDPSCENVLRIWKDNQLVKDGSKACAGQNRGLDIGAGASLTLDFLSWDLTDDNGNQVLSGDYQIEYFIPNEELSSFNTVQVQTPVIVPDGVTLEISSTARDGVHKSGSPSIITVKLHNSNTDSVNLDFSECMLNFNDMLMGECGPSSLDAHELVTIDQFTIIPETGTNSYEISLGDGVLTQQLIIEAVENSEITFDENQFENLDIELEFSGDEQFYELDIFDSEIVLTNTGEDTVVVNFTNSCRGEIWVVDKFGDVVYDSRDKNGCVELGTQNIIPPTESRNIQQSEWNFYDKDTCLVTPGELIVIGEIPEMGKFTSERINFYYESRANCETQDLQLISEITNIEDFTISSTLVSEEEIEITWFTQCNMEFMLMNLTNVLFGSPLNCEDNLTKTTRFTTLDIEDIKLDMSTYEDGTYFIKIDSTSQPRFSITSSFEWVNPDKQEEEITEEEVGEVIESRFVAGTWGSTSTNLGTCWFLDTADEGMLTLHSAPGFVTWLPERGLSGQYIVHETEPAPECSDFSSPSIVIEEILTEEAPEIIVEESEVEQEIVTPIETSDDEISPVIITASAVIVSTGILSLLVAFISTNESLRIPTTAAGLWLLGLIGKTNETSDGRYQRGRLMGYLTANPGCHFRALMAALEMSNGQITHHLKILEDEDRIWRKADGRLVRFYPFTSNLHPGLDEGELPMPPLSPDPNSLQGKILKLLDQDGTMNKYPTQVDLAHRLEKSQQLVSHHLRTLENYGLVEKKRSGVKNRYKLTKEALFLLETTEY